MSASAASRSRSSSRTRRVVRERGGEGLQAEPQRAPRGLVRRLGERGHEHAEPLAMRARQHAHARTVLAAPRAGAAAAALPRSTITTPPLARRASASSSAAVQTDRPVAGNAPPPTRPTARVSSTPAAGVEAADQQTAQRHLPRQETQSCARRPRRDRRRGWLRARGRTGREGIGANGDRSRRMRTEPPVV